MSKLVSEHLPPKDDLLTKSIAKEPYPLKNPESKSNSHNNSFSDSLCSPLLHFSCALLWAKKRKILTLTKAKWKEYKTFSRTVKTLFLSTMTYFLIILWCNSRRWIRSNSLNRIPFNFRFPASRTWVRTKPFLWTKKC